MYFDFYKAQAYKDMVLVIVEPVFHDHLSFVARIYDTNSTFYLGIDLFYDHLFFTTKITGAKGWS